MRLATLALALIPLVAPDPARAQSDPAPRLFTGKDAIWAAAILGGSIAISTADVHIIRVWTHPDNRSGARDTLARRLAKLQEGTLTVGNLALWGIARLAKAPAMADITFHAAEAVVLGSVAAQVIRGPLGRSRPYHTDKTDQYDFHPFQGFTNFKYRAFPSIHTSSAFAVATVYTLETYRRAKGATWIVGPIAYTIAAGPALARLYQGQHWASDLFAGAFLGTLAGVKVIRYNHDVDPDNRVNRFFLGARNVQVGLGDGTTAIRFATTF